MKTLNLHTILNNQPATMLWAGNRVCDFNSVSYRGIKENQLGVKDVGLK